MNEPVVTACECTGVPKSILDEAGKHMLVGGVVVCPECLKNPFGEPVTMSMANGSSITFADLPDSEGGEA